MRSDTTWRRVEVGDVLFAALLIMFCAICLSALPYDFRDLCYLFSLEQGRWVMQEWVHPIYIPILDLFRGALGVLGYHGRMLVPVEMLNIAVTMTALVLLYRLARRFPGASLTAAVTVSAAALSVGFSSAAMRPTPYALALLTQTIALLLLISADPVPAHRYALAGAFAGVTMGLHASAMALAPVAVVCAVLEPDPRRTRSLTWLRIAAFGAAMLATVIACWTTFILYRSIGRKFFEHQDFASLFAGIEQVPGTSIYTSGSAIVQLTTFARTLSQQGELILVPALIILPLVAAWRWRKRLPLGPLEQRLAIAAGANFAGVAGFFLINNTHNGFIFASLTLVPVLLAVAIRDSRLLLVLLLYLTVPAAVLNVRTISQQTGKDPLLAEVRFLHRWLGPRDVLLTPGTPFPEVLYLAHLNVFEVANERQNNMNLEVPAVRPGPVLRARVAWWLSQGGRVVYAFGDDATDFTEDANGAAKLVQIFWRQETLADERRPVLAMLREELESSGLDLRETITSPGGQRYANIQLGAQPASAMTPPAAISIAQLPTVSRRETADVAVAHYLQRMRYLTDLEAALPDDPWRACDLQLLCQGSPYGIASKVGCRRHPECGSYAWAQDEDTDEADQQEVDEASLVETCFWEPVTDRRTIEQYLNRWVQKEHLPPLSDWGFSADRQNGEMNLVFSDGAVALRWRLLDSCEATAVTTQVSGAIAADAFAPQLAQALVAGLPLPTVRALGRSDPAETR